MGIPERFRTFERVAIEHGLVRRFEEQVACWPRRPAIEAGSGSLTYASLNEFANRIACAVLGARGPRAEPVAIAVAQGPSLIAAILGVLKAGKFYVPLEATQRRERVARMLSGSGTALVIVDTAALPVIRALAMADVDTLEVDALDPSLPTGNPGIALAPGAYAYIYYTTGSTGQPKGVVDSHRNVLHNIMRYTNGLRITCDDRLTLLQSASFSGAVSSMFGALLNGAAVCPFDVRNRSAEELADYVERERITIYHSVPTIFRSFLRGDRVFPAVRVVRLEGDQATPLDIALFRRHFGPDCVLAHGLGATETGIVRRFLSRKDSCVEEGIVPIGHPIEDMDVFVADEQGLPVAAGITGEIAVRSEYLACGYWNDNAATARAFVADPHDATKRVFRTGDLGRMRVDGCLEHLGRLDSRVKIRGATVALAEVEAALRDLPSIREAAVVARDDAYGERRVVAFYVPFAGQQPTVSALRRQLAERLPPAAIPSSFARLEQLPQNESLKVDRARLPAPSCGRPHLDQPYVRPRDPNEALLAHVWESLLQVAPIGALDDFFELGGDSLLAARMIAAVEEATGVPLPLSILTTSSTLARVADALAPGAAAWAPIVPIQDAGAKPPFYFLHGDYVGGGLYCREIARALGPDQPFLALTPCGLDGADAPRTIDEMAERHLRALRARQPHGPYFLGGNCNGGLIALEMARRLAASGEPVERLIVVRTSARNVRYAAFHAVLERSGRWLGIPAPLRRALVRRARWYVDAWAAASPAERVRLVLVKLGRLVPALLQARAHSSAAKRRTAAEGSRRDRGSLIATFVEAAADHIPLRYPDRIIILWPEEEPESAAEAMTRWRRISPHAELEIIPGDHLTAITVHAQSFARRLAAHLA